MRLFLLIGVWWELVACDPIRTAAIQVAPRRVPETDSVGIARAFAVAERIATAHALGSTPGGERWLACFGERTLFLCWREYEGEAQFHIRDAGFRLAPEAERLRDDLLTDLRAQFGSAQVRECTWRGSGCIPIALTDSAQRNPTPPEA